MQNQIYIAPSILSADLLKLEEQVRTVEENGADFIHVDVMDGHFVPNITFGPNIVKALRRITRLPLDVHLMITNPDNYIPNFIEAGANIVTVHAEVCAHLNKTLNTIKSLGAKAGVSINPATPLNSIEEVTGIIDLLLIMSVNPGFGGQKFIPSSINKIERARKLLDEAGSDALLEVDGGISDENAADVVRAGANVLVAGSAIFASNDIAASVRKIRKSVENAFANFS